MRLIRGRLAPCLAVLSITAALGACGGSSAKPSGVASGSAESASSAPTPPSPYNPVYGLDLGIHVLSGNSATDPVPDSEIRKLLTVLQGRTEWIRLYSVLPPWQNTAKIAHEMGFKVSAAAYLNGKSDNDEPALNRLAELVDKGYVDYAQAGNEPIWTHLLTVPQELAYLKELKDKVHGKVPVGTSEPHPVLLAHPEIMRACDLVLANLAPISFAIPLNQSLDYIKTNYAKLVSLAGGAEVGIGETNWPSHGLGGTVAQEAKYFTDFEGWARAKNVKAFYYVAFDEPFFAKVNEEGSHWGIFTSDLQLKPGMAGVFAKQ